jgi:F-type H+-transporting ATPase subunit delta
MAQAPQTSARSMPSRTAANRYAKALMDVALQEKADLVRVEDELASFTKALVENEETAKILLNPAVPAPRKGVALKAIVKQTAPLVPVGKLLVLLAERDRLAVLPDLLASYRERMLAHQNVVRAEVTTAGPLPDSQAETIRDRLARATGREVRIATRVDPSIIGGLVARLGSTVFDGSVSRHLEKMKDRLTGGL